MIRVPMGLVLCEDVRAIWYPCRVAVSPHLCPRCPCRVAVSPHLCPQSPCRVAASPHLCLHVHTVFRLCVCLHPNVPFL